MAPHPLSRPLHLLAASALASLPLIASAGDPSPSQVGVVSHVSVVSDKVQDVSSLAAWKASFIKPGMSEKEKAIAVWKSMVMFRHQSIPPNEFCSNSGTPSDPIKTFNVYGYNMCDGASAGITQLARQAGLEARGWGITGHSVPEVKIDGKWSMLDSSLINYFEKPDGTIAGVEEIAKAADDWLLNHPELRGDVKALDGFQRRNGWTGWKDGPELLSRCKFYDAGGFWPAGTHGWNGTLIEYGNPKKNFLYEYGAALGYQVNMQLRAGERITRNWSNTGMHIDMAAGRNGIAKAVAGKGDMKYTPAWGDLAPGRVGNGTHEYEVPLADPALSAAMLKLENLTNVVNRAEAAVLRVENADKPGVLVVRMPSSYVYLGGQVAFDADLGKGGSIAVSFSDNNGLDWKPITRVAATGKQQVDLKEFILRRYDYRLKFELTGRGTGLNSLKITNDIQHSQRALPALDKGENKIAFKSGPQEGTITIEGNTTPAHQGKNLLYTDFHPTETGIAKDMIRLSGNSGDLAFPIETPGDITRLRIGAHYRARDARDQWVVTASFDGGKTFQPIGELKGPYPGYSTTLATTQVPASSRTALVKFTGTQRNTLVLLDLRIDADYREPAGGFAPIKITYTWTENGQEKQDVHIARSPEEAYAIQCAAKPAMKSIVLERAPL